MALIINNEYQFTYDFTKDFILIYEITTQLLDLSNNHDLSVSLINDQDIQKLNKQYRNIDDKTDVISFAMLDSEDFALFDNSQLDLGDIFISVETAQEQAANLNQNVKKEIRFLFVHGLLHLLGYDHQNQRDEEIMFKLQKEIIHEFYQIVP